jgi:hypothetical protein
MTWNPEWHDLASTAKDVRYREALFPAGVDLQASPLYLQTIIDQ